MQKAIYYTGYAPIGKSTRKWEHFIKIQEIFLRKREKGSQLPAQPIWDILVCPPFNPTQPPVAGVVAPRLQPLWRFWDVGRSRRSHVSGGHHGAPCRRGCQCSSLKGDVEMIWRCHQHHQRCRAACTVSVIFIITPIVIPSCSSF